MKSSFVALSALALVLSASTAAAQSVDYTYDVAGRLTEARSDAYTITYTYDPAGNLLSRRVTVADAGPGGGDGGVTADGGVGADAGPPGGSDGSVGPVDGGGSGADAGTGEPMDDGCGCATPGRGADTPLAILLGLLALGLLRRRRPPLSPSVTRGIAALAALAVIGVGAEAQASRVCPSGCDYTSITEALQNDTLGETITVEAGVYFESGMILEQGRTLRSETNEPGSVIIDGGGGQQILRAFGGAGTLIEGITFRNGNATTGNGGAVGSSGNVVIRNCVFEGNQALRGGAVAIQGGTVLDSTFRNNLAEGGGAIYSVTSGVIERCDFTGNRAVDTGATTASGGAVLAGQSDLVIVDSDFDGNEAMSFRAYGGAVAITSASPVTCALLNVQMTGNRATGTTNGWGGGLRTSGCFLTMLGGTISGNQATGSGGRGGGIYIASNDPVALRGTRISGNTATIGGGGIFCSTTGGTPRPGGSVTGNTPDEVLGCSVCTAMATEACTTGLSGMCSAGMRTCGAGGTWGSCAPDMPPAARETMCSDLNDDDCDGLVDAADTECMAPPNDTAADLPASGCVEDPISTFTGELFESFEPDLDLGGLIPVRFSRYYASRLLVNAVPAALGDNWRHSFEYDLVDTGTDVEVLDPRGRTIRFAPNGASYDLAVPGDVEYQLVTWGDGWLFGDPRTQRVYRFNAAGQLVEILDGNGNALTLTYAGSDLTSVSDGRGRTLTFTYGGNGRISRVSDGTRNVDFFYAGTDLTRVNDPRDNDTTFTYQSGSLMTTWTPPSGAARLTMTYDGMGRVATQTDAAGHAITMSYGAGATTVTDGGGDMVQHSHDPAGAMTADQAEDTTTATPSFDNDARLVSRVNRLGDTLSRSYDALSGRLETETREDGTTVTHRYESRRVLGIVFWDRVETTYPDMTTRRWSFDTGGNLLTYEDRRGESWTYTYDARGRLLTRTTPTGGTTSYTWNTDDTLASRTDHAANTTGFAYDALLRLSTVTRADASTESFTYDAQDRILTTTDGRGNTTTATYDVNGNLASLTDRAGSTTGFEYDAMDRLVATVDPGTQRRTITRDVEGRVTDMVGDGATTSFAYDARGRPVSRTDGAGAQWDLTWNAEGALTSITDPLGGTTMMTRDARQRLTGMTSAAGRAVSFTRDSDGRVTDFMPAAGPTESRTYDAEGAVTGYDEGGLTSGLTRDAAGRITEATDPLGSARPRTVDPQGRVTAIDDPLGNQTTYAYDNRNRVSTITFPGGLGTLSLTYDENGNPTSRAYSDGTSFDYTWDAEDRLTAADGITMSYDVNGDVVETNGVAITRDGFGRMTGVTYDTGQTVSYTYDAAGRLATVTDWIGGTHTFTYDMAGRLTSLDRPNGVRTTYARDDDGDVSMIVHGTHGSITLTRDAAGRITNALRSPDAMVTTALADLDLTYDAASQVSARTYDAMGRLTSDGAETCTWNLASQLTGRGSVSYGYDARGQLTSRTSGGTTTDYVWSYAHGLPSVLIERQGTTDQAYNVYTPGGALLYRVDAATDARVFHHFDEVGHTSLLTDEAGTVAATYAYGPYGELLGETGSADNPFRWQGRYGVMRDADTGLSYVRARWFDHDAARFISRDVLAQAAPRVANPYALGRRDPLAWIDVDGRRNLWLRFVDWLYDAPPPEVNRDTGGVESYGRFRHDWWMQGIHPHDPGRTRDLVERRQDAHRRNPEAIELRRVERESARQAAMHAERVASGWVSVEEELLGDIHRFLTNDRLQPFAIKNPITGRIDRGFLTPEEAARTRALVDRLNQARREFDPCYRRPRPPRNDTRPAAPPPAPARPAPADSIDSVVDELGDIFVIT